MSALVSMGPLWMGVRGSLSLVQSGPGGFSPDISRAGLQLSRGSGELAAVTGLRRPAGKQEPAEMWTAGFFLNVSMPFEARAHLRPNMLFANMPSPPLGGRNRAPKHRSRAELRAKPPHPALPKGPIGLCHLGVIIQGCWSRVTAVTWGWAERRATVKVLLPLDVWGTASIKVL